MHCNLGYEARVGKRTEFTGRMQINGAYEGYDRRQGYRIDRRTQRHTPLVAA